MNVTSLPCIYTKRFRMSSSNKTFNEAEQEKIAEQIYFFNKDSFTSKPQKLNQIPLNMLQKHADGKEYLKTSEGKKYKKECDAKQKGMVCQLSEHKTVECSEDSENHEESNCYDTPNCYDTYFKDVNQILEKTCDRNEKFTQLFYTRFGLSPQIELDTKLQATLERPTLSHKDLLILTQKHFNQFGGVHTM